MSETESDESRIEKDKIQRIQRDRPYRRLQRDTKGSRAKQRDTERDTEGSIKIQRDSERYRGIQTDIER